MKRLAISFLHGDIETIFSLGDISFMGEQWISSFAEAILFDIQSTGEESFAGNELYDFIEGMRVFGDAFVKRWNLSVTLQSEDDWIIETEDDKAESSDSTMLFESDAEGDEGKRLRDADASATSRRKRRRMRVLDDAFATAMQSMRLRF